MSDEEVELYSGALKELLSEFPYLFPEGSTLAEDKIRELSLMNKFEETRENKGLSIKEVSSKLKIPQYRLRAVEKVDKSELIPEMFWKYSEFLGITDFVWKWIKENEELAGRLELIEKEQDDRGG